MPSITLSIERYEELLEAEIRMKILREQCIKSDRAYLNSEALIVLGCPEEEEPTNYMQKMLL